MSSVPSLCAHICYTETVKAPPSLGVPDLPPARPALCVSRPQPVSTPRQGATNLDFKSIVTVTVTSPRLPPYHPFKVECKVDFFLKHVKLFLGVFGDKVPVRKLINYSFVSTPKLVTAHSKALVLAVQHCLQCPDERQQTLGFVWSIYSLVEQMAVSDGMGAGGRRHLPEESWMLKGSE